MAARVHLNSYWVSWRSGADTPTHKRETENRGQLIPFYSVTRPDRRSSWKRGSKLFLITDDTHLHTWFTGREILQPATLIGRVSDDSLVEEARSLPLIGTCDDIRCVGEKAHMVHALKSSAHVAVLDLDDFVEKVKDDAQETSAHSDLFTQELPRGQEEQGSVCRNNAAV